MKFIAAFILITLTVDAYSLVTTSSDEYSGPRGNQKNLVTDILNYWNSTNSFKSDIDVHFVTRAEGEIANPKPNTIYIDVSHLAGLYATFQSVGITDYVKEVAEFYVRVKNALDFLSSPQITNYNHPFYVDFNRYFSPNKFKEMRVVIYNEMMDTLLLNGAKLTRIRILSDNLFKSNPRVKTNFGVSYGISLWSFKNTIKDKITKIIINSNGFEIVANYDLYIDVLLLTDRYSLSYKDPQGVVRDLPNIVAVPAEDGATNLIFSL